MKKTFTKLSTVLLTGLLVASFTVNAQTTTYASTETMHKKAAIKTDSAATLNAGQQNIATVAVKKSDDADTSWHPQRRIWGYAFGDAYYVQHAPPLTSAQGKENNYYQTPTGRNAFQFRRIYLGYDYDINKKFKAEVLLAAEPNENTAPTSSTSSVVSGDNLADGRMSFYIKNFNLRVREVWSGTDFVIGEMATPGFALNESGTNAPTSLSEATWSYRSVERTITDFHKNNSYDVGAALQGTFDPKTKNFGYVFMIGDNTQSNLTTVYNPNSAVSPTNPNPNTGFFKIFYGDLWAKFLDKKLYVDLYADYAQTSSSIASAAVASGTIDPQEHNMFKLFVAYNAKPFTIGVEAYTQKLKNAMINSVDKSVDNATVNAFSFWIRGVITPGKWGYFARYDNYNPDSKFDKNANYAVNSNGYSSFDPTTKEQFVTAGLDFTPAKNIHFMPNIWLTQYKTQYDPTHTGYVPDNHTLVYRMTFFYTFGK